MLAVKELQLRGGCQGLNKSVSKIDVCHLCEKGLCEDVNTG